MVKVDRISNKKLQTEIWSAESVVLPDILKINDCYLNQWECGDVILTNVEFWPDIAGISSIGGDAQKVWFICDQASTIAELSPTDLSLLRWYNFGTDQYLFKHVGGNLDTILVYCERPDHDPPLPTKIVEIDPSDFSLIRNDDFILTSGLAADHTGIWSSYTDQGMKYLREHSYSDFSLIRSVEVDYSGVLGGQSDGLWMLSTYLDDEDTYHAIVRLDPVDFSIIKRCIDEFHSGYDITGVGGNDSSLYVTGQTGYVPEVYVERRGIVGLRDQFLFKFDSGRLGRDLI